MLDDLVGEIPAAATWVEFDVSSAVTGDGTYTFVLVGDHKDGIPSTRATTQTPGGIPSWW